MHSQQYQCSWLLNILFHFSIPLSALPSLLSLHDCTEMLSQDTFTTIVVPNCTNQQKKKNKKNKINQYAEGKNFKESNLTHHWKEQ